MRGRPSENIVRKTKYTLEFFDYPSKPELGGRSVWHFDDKKNKKGAWKVEQFYPKDEKLKKVKHMGKCLLLWLLKHQIVLMLKLK